MLYKTVALARSSFVTRRVGYSSPKWVAFRKGTHSLLQGQRALPASPTGTRPRPVSPPMTTGGMPSSPQCLVFGNPSLVVA